MADATLFSAKISMANGSLRKTTLFGRISKIFARKNLKNCNEIVDSFFYVIYNVKAVEVRV